MSFFAFVFSVPTHKLNKTWNGLGNYLDTPASKNHANFTKSFLSLTTRSQTCPTSQHRSRVCVCLPSCFPSSSSRASSRRSPSPARVGWFLINFRQIEYISLNIVWARRAWFLVNRKISLAIGCKESNYRSSSWGLYFCSSQPSSVHWLSSSIFPCCRRRPAMVTSVQISLIVAPHPKTHTFSESLW